MKCALCKRPLLSPTVTIQKKVEAADYGPVCARRAFPDLYGQRSLRIVTPSKKTKGKDQLELELTE
jgi:hypothetical protein